MGLRPGRDSVRLETELMTVASTSSITSTLIGFQSKEDRQSMRVVHNYGHGGGGITLSWGCAGHAVRLIQQLLQQLPHARFAQAKL